MIIALKQSLLRAGAAALAALFGYAVAALIGLPAVAQQKDTLRIGYQKGAFTLSLLKQKALLEKKLAPLGVEVKWVDFPAGPQMLEGLNVGAIDFGGVGEAPPIFAQAAGAQFVYVGYESAAPAAEAVLVTKGSPLKSVADLKGKKVALNKGSNVHYLLVKTLEKHGLKYADIQPVFLAPADARAAFERGSVDAWVIWDPFQAAAEKQIEARVLADGTGVVNNHQFYLAARGFAQRRPDVIKVLFEVASGEGKWIAQNYKAAADALAPLQGLEPAVIELALRRYTHDIHPISDAILTEQQKVADTFADLKLIPKKIAVRQASLLAQR
jgi:sulfonate transport system substrate-binding protein